MISILKNKNKIRSNFRARLEKSVVVESHDAHDNKLKLKYLGVFRFKIMISIISFFFFFFFTQILKCKIYLFYIKLLIYKYY